MFKRGYCQPNRRACRTLIAIFRCRRGFTLMELLTVLIIIAVLVAIAIPVYAQVDQTSKDRVDQANVRILNGATMQWVSASEANKLEGQTTDALKTALGNTYISGWPSSPNGKIYQLDDSSRKWVVVDR